MRKTLRKLGIPQVIFLKKSTKKTLKLISNLIVKDYVSPQKSRTRQGCPILPLLFNRALKLIASSIKQIREIKGIQMRKEKNNCPYLQII